MKKAKGQDRRRHTRLPQKVPIIVVHGDFEGIYLESEDLSLGGILLRLDRPFPEGTEILLQFHLPNLPRPFEVRGQVANIQGKDGMGVKFTDIEPEAEKAIWNYMISREK